jgi:dTDP-4-dehydrorhamnose reductase
MVIGYGLLGKLFSEYEATEQFVVFASGVSDSKSMDLDAYKREWDLLVATMSKYPEAILVYFSTCSIHDPSLHGNHYVAHKLAVEELLTHSGQSYMIFRVSNIAGWGGNPKTIFHFLVQSILHKRKFTVWQKAYRNLIDGDDVFKLVDYFLKKGMSNQIINIANPVSYSTPQMVCMIEDYFGVKACYDLIDAGHYFHIDTTIAEEFASKAAVDFGSNYFERLLKKYYPNA